MESKEKLRQSIVNEVVDLIERARHGNEFPNHRDDPTLYEPEFVVKLIMRRVRARYKDGKERQYLYFIKSEDTNEIKIGITKNVLERAWHFACAGITGGKKVLVLLRGDRELEKIVHYLFNRDRIEGEWFYLSPRMQMVISLLEERMDRLYKNIMTRANSYLSKEVAYVTNPSQGFSTALVEFEK